MFFSATSCRDLLSGPWASSALEAAIEVSYQSIRRGALVQALYHYHITNIGIEEQGFLRGGGAESGLKPGTRNIKGVEREEP
jgi:hypothetical protein